MDSSTIDLIADGLLWGVCFIFSVTAHEAAHALVAKWGGDDTAYLGGQVSLNPWPHIQREPIGMVVVPIVMYALSGFMFGWASTPYDPYWAQRHPKRAAWMALAGPVANLLVACAAVGFARGLLALGLVPDNPELWQTLRFFLVIMVYLNLLLFIFNLLPIAPLDGGSAVVLLFPERMAGAVLEKTHALGGAGIILAWLVMNRIGEVVDLAGMSVFLLGI